jgi:hypothetical protein
MKKLLLSLLCAAASLTAAADSWSYTVTKGQYTKHDFSKVTVDTKSDIVFQKGQTDEQTWNILITSVGTGTNAFKNPTNDGTAPAGIMFGSAANPAKDITLYSASNFSGKTISKVTVIVNGGASSNCNYDATVTVGSFTETKSKAVTGSASNGTTISWTPQTAGEVIINFHNNTATAGKGKNSGIKLCSIAIEYTEGTTPGKTPVTLSWTPESDNLDFGADFTAPEFNCSVAEAQSSVVFESSNPGLLDYVDGEWKFTKNVSGTAFINASIPETDATYSATPATYTLTVAEKVKTPSQLSFSTSEWSVMEGTTDLSGAPVLSNELGIEVIYSSSDETVAKFVEGALTLVGTGTTTITASPADTETYTNNATYTLTVTPKPVLGAITVNGSEVADNTTVSGVVNTPVTFASANADLMVITIMNSNADIILNEEYVEESTYTWTPTTADTYTVEITSTGCSDEKSITFDIDVTEKPAISLTADFIFAGDDANVVALASKVIEASSVQTDNATNDLNGVTLTAENGVTVSFAISGTENHPRYWHNDKTGNEVRAYNGNKITVTTPDNNYAINSIEFTKGGGGKWDMTTASAGQLTEQTWTYNNETVTSAVFTPSNRTDIGTISVTIAPRPKTPAISVNDEEVTDFESSIDLKKGTVTVKITAADASHHLYYKHEGSEGVSVLANNDFTHIESNTHTFDISTNGTLTFYAQHPESKLESVKKYLTFTGDSTAIFEVEAEGNGEAEWFDLTGRRVAKPAKGGIFIIKQGSKTSKRAF